MVNVWLINVGLDGMRIILDNLQLRRKLMRSSSSAIGPRLFPITPQSTYRPQKSTLHETSRTRLPNISPVTSPADRMQTHHREDVLNTSIAYWAPLISRGVFQRQREQERQEHYSLAL